MSMAVARMKVCWDNGNPESDRQLWLVSVRFGLVLQLETGLPQVQIFGHLLCNSGTLRRLFKLNSPVCSSVE